MVSSDPIMTRSRHHHAAELTPALGFAFALVLASLPSAAADPASPLEGREIYLQLCTDCHGRDGEGVPGKYRAPLGGDRSLEKLTSIVIDTMPEDAPEKCVGEEAEAVVRYLYETFYSRPAATPEPEARIELSRLTNRQYAQAAADLLSMSRAPQPPARFGGVNGAYYKGRNFRQNNRIHERLDPKVEFDFADGAPDADGIPSDEFAIRWSGSLRATDTGEYEFILRTPNGARLWVNDDAEPLIDAWVVSGDLQETRASVKLLGGRVYPLRLDFFKSKEKRAAVMLEWVPPHGAREVIPPRVLSPEEVRPTFIVNTPFPPDDASVGYERGVSVSPAWEEATTHAAIELANHVVRNLDSLAGASDNDERRSEKILEFCQRFVEVAFRRPLSSEQQQMFVQRHFDSASNVESAVKAVVILALKSPRFLYLGLGAHSPDDFEVAARLSFGLWDSLPDQELLRLAGEGRLSEPTQARDQALRMLNDPRARAKVHDFLHHWLQLGHADNLAKDPELYPGFTPRLIADLRTSLDLFLESEVWSDRADYRELLLADYLYLNPALAEFYGVPAPAHDDFGKAAAATQNRAGVLTHPYLLALFAYPRSTSPIHRGVFLTRNIVGRGLKPPPVAVAFEDAAFDPTLSMREKVETLTRPEACQACHATINPLGFSLEHFDAVGRFRTTDGDRPVQAASDYVTSDGATIHLANAKDLAQHAAASTPAHRAFIEQLFHQIVKQPVRAYGLEVMDRLHTSFTESDFNIRQLLVEIATLAALHDVVPAGPPTTSHRPPSAEAQPQHSSLLTRHSPLITSPPPRP
jgi:mono/diheme cytochrome c family protein